MVSLPNDHATGLVEPARRSAATAGAPAQHGRGGRHRPPAIDAPVTVGFGSRDFVLLPHQSRHLDQLPPGTRVETLPGCGHVPMVDNPHAVATFITAATVRAGA
jgi:pimeloyl-ACP methyl ester carboxylesterase